MILKTKVSSSGVGLSSVSVLSSVSLSELEEAAKLARLSVFMFNEPALSDMGYICIVPIRLSEFSIHV